MYGVNHNHGFFCFYLQTVSINKALSGQEMPLKVKHARVAIIGTFHSGGAHSFWAVALRQPLQVSEFITGDSE